MTSSDLDPWPPLHVTFAHLHAETRVIARARVAANQLEHVHIFLEMERRIWQLGWGLHNIERVAEQAHAAALEDVISMFKGGPDLVEQTAQGIEAVEFLCDAFYVLAFRVRELARSIPGLSFEALGVRNVRNLFIIHPEKKNGVVPYSFGSGGGRLGPVYKPGQTPEQAAFFTDPGLISNAHEFAAQLSERLRIYPRPK